MVSIKTASSSESLNGLCAGKTGQVQFHKIRHRFGSLFGALPVSLLQIR